MAALPQQHQQQQRPWWQQSPCAIVHGLQQGLHDNLQRAAAAAPWAQQQQQQQQRKQQQQPAPHSAVPMAAASAHASHSGGASSSGSGSKAKAKAAKAAAAAAADGEPVTREELGRATWVFLHTLAAQFPARPTRQQQRDARGVLDALTRIYPCGECARHFGEIVRADPPDVSSGAALQRWMCRAHNVVNARLGKPAFNCELAAARWAPLDCDDGDEGGHGRGGACDLSVGSAPPPPRKRW